MSFLNSFVNVCHLFGLHTGGNKVSLYPSTLQSVKADLSVQPVDHRTAVEHQMCGSGIEPYRELQVVMFDNSKQSLLEIYTNSSEHKNDVYMDLHSPKWLNWCYKRGKKYYNLKICSKKECCKQCRHGTLKSTLTKWPVQKQPTPNSTKTNITPRRNID